MTPRYIMEVIPGAEGRALVDKWADAKECVWVGETTGSDCFWNSRTGEMIEINLGPAPTAEYHKAAQS